MIQLTSVLLSVLAMTGNFLTGGLVLDHPKGSVAPVVSQPQDQSAASVFAASLTRYYIGFAQSGPKWTAEVDDVTKQIRAYISELVKANKLVGAGQVTDGKDLRRSFTAL